MKFRNYLESIAGVSIYPLISLVIFFAFFVILLVYVFRIDRKKIDRMKNIPLEDGLVRKNILSLLALLLVAPLANAQGETPARDGAELMMYLVLGLLGVLIVVLVVVLVQMLELLKKLTTTRPSATEAAASTSWFSENWWMKFGGFSVSLTEEEKILIADHDYDGIHELDNRMPPWLQFLFVGTVVIAILYGLYFHFLGWGDLQQAELDKELAAAAVQKEAYLAKVGASIDENSVTMLDNEGKLKEGGVIYQEKCAACHAADGGGGVGPNLTDGYWLHGGSIQAVFKTIKYGIPEKGMIAWEKQLPPAEMQKVASYIMTLQGTRPQTPKEPQGELYIKATVAGDSTLALR
ncbi:hypothetical protein GCM10027275_08730 [Rhabdobacter roseus]|uniref:Cytochrome c oxidase cbb3-type subunit 3 n=1 Tax=Rhabdobacter roseus TaxID=1655419 RepID=A0A840TNI3_9BACT|nr:cbb3-type cytochrome c oxidase N-terminal domain-containing protein [Rhabdobacter roseus]MBB5282773.1 cytochrome c oxidase cbb3-type subunit 3 [Rhabdobacter roseus]